MTDHPPLSAAAVVAGLNLSDDAQKLLRPNTTAEAYFDALVNAGLFADAIRVVVRLMTPKQAVWWGCLCGWAAKRANTGPAVRAAAVWLRDPTDANRRAAGDVAKSIGVATLGGLLASAVFHAEGSVSAPGATPIASPPGLTGTLIGTMVLAGTAARAADPAGIRRKLLAIAVEVYRGTNVWTGSHRHPATV